jgi:hypothetical protein
MKLKLSLSEFLKEDIDLRGTAPGASGANVDIAIKSIEEEMRNRLARMAQFCANMKSLDNEQFERDFRDSVAGLEHLQDTLKTLNNPKANALNYLILQNLNNFKQAIQTGNTTFSPIYTPAGLSPKGQPRESQVARQVGPSNMQHTPFVPKANPNLRKLPEPKIDQNLIAYSPYTKKIALDNR